MKHLILTCVVLTLTVTAADAASWYTLSVSPEIAFPVREMGDTYDRGLGVSGRFEIVEAWSAMYGVGVGYLTFDDKGGGDGSTTVMPVEAIYRHRFGGGLFYAAVQSGVRLQQTTDTVNGTVDDARFSLTPVLGMFVPLGEAVALDVSALVPALPSDAQYMGIRVSVALGF